ncbi:hypothetical protein GCG54_00014030 [Colletotrichum gloeosporioides]|uniref:ToxB-like N-terminal ascomycota domain-containing protein n=1 Tax=Colletotrichum gloeosporioides TaxID=474922 RepID=A0A8H4CF96_COLGL|nr:uncharacterized protein GCG54_00014030 [Colletotrichum gloeosporioides]KAF3802793.1 hypothetical protein GCG54_00014030 [Colletotrichum gloeosporioides]
MALFIGDAFSRDEGCNIELLNINQAVADSACIPIDSTQVMTDRSACGSPLTYKVHVNGNCGVGLDDDQQLDPSNSLRKAGFC